MLVGEHALAELGGFSEVSETLDLENEEVESLQADIVDLLD